MFAERSLLLGGAAAIALPGLLWACLSLREEAQPEQNACASCHGSDERAEGALGQAAPPRDLMGNATPDYPGVGAHQAHLAPSATHAGVACTECHLVPEASNSPGHADSALPAELEFGPLARTGAAAPRYDAVARRCSDTYCHGASSPIWTESASEPCGGCHALPPAAPHPQSERCAACHADVVDVEHRIVDPQRHVDGRVDLGVIACPQCHGGDASPAPPPGLDGQTRTDQRGVGAHAAHLAGGAQSRPLACSECHPVPAAVHPFQHPDGAPASVVFTGSVSGGGRAPVWDPVAGACSDGWCHGPSAGSGALVDWTRAEPLACDGCHGLPPPAPHPEVQDCGLCHADVYDSAEGAIARRDRHVDGVVDVRVPEACTGCHSSDGAGVGDGDGGTGTATGEAAPSSGAHAVHLAPRGPARAVRCDECHQVPSEVFSPGHVDSALPAEVLFTGVARAFEASPLFAAGACAQTYCHGDQFIGGRPSGGVDTRPRWEPPGTTSNLTCQSCHGLPPPAPHPQPADDCSSCHRNVDATRLFVAPTTHVDGVVTFFLP